jgi:hypothetical protein
MKNRRPRYKVVKKRNRYSAVVNGNSKYAIKYLPGSVVEALPYTMGIMVFKYKTCAERWCEKLNISRKIDYHDDDYLMVIKVLPLDKGEKRIFIHAGVSTKHLDSFYLGIVGDSWRVQEAPYNTYSHMKVKVLE